MDANLAKNNLLCNKSVRKASTVNKSISGKVNSDNGQITITPKRTTIDDNVTSAKIVNDQTKNKLSQVQIKLEKSLVSNNLQSKLNNSQQPENINKELSPNSSKKEPVASNKKKLNSTKKTTTKKSKLMQKMEDNLIDASGTTDLIIKPTKPKYQKKTLTNKKLKIEQSSNEATIKIINCSNLVNNGTASVTQTPKKQTDQPKINNFTVPILNSGAKILTKDEVNKIVIQQNSTNRINLSASGLILCKYIKFKYFRKDYCLT